MGPALFPNHFQVLAGRPASPPLSVRESFEHQRRWNLEPEESWTTKTDPGQHQAMGLLPPSLGVGVGGAETERCPN